MSDIQVLPVDSTRDRRVFVTFPWHIYRDDPLWVPPLLPQRRARLDPVRGTLLKRGTGQCFIAWKGREPVGTICAAVDPPTNRQRGARECIVGFFEAFDDYDVVAALFRRAAAWARSRGLNALFGPFDLDYEDGYGILIEGRDRPPALLCGHTPAYYQTMFERFGFKPARGDNLAYAIYPDSPAIERLARVAARLRSRTRIVIRSADLRHWEAEIDNIHRLLGLSLSHLPDHIGWQRDSVQALLEPFRTIVDPELVLFAELDGETIGWLPGVPNLNEAFIHANGLRRPWDYVKLWWHMRRQPDCLAVKSVLVPPAYWGTGVAILLFDELARRAVSKGYKWADLSLTSEENPNTPQLLKHLGAKLYKRYRVYRYWIPE